MDVLLIINPNAKKGKGMEKAREIVDIFKEHSISVSVAYTRGPDHAEELAAQAANEGFDVIVAAGGDGSVNEVVNGIMKSNNPERVKLGIIPIGRGNDYAYSLGIPTDVRKAAQIIVEGCVRKVDLGKVTDLVKDSSRYFLNGNGYGFEPLVNYRAMRFKHLNGMPSYIVAFIGILLAPPKPYLLKLIDDEEEVLLQTQQVSICLGRRMGSAFMLAPNAVLDDGYFDLMYTKRPLSSFSLFVAALQFIRGTHVDNKKTFHTAKVRKVRILSECANLTSHVDGEMMAIKDGMEYDICLLARCMRIFAPASSFRS